MSNYPPGVTGSEYAIAGPQDSYTTNDYVTCGACDWEGDVDIDVNFYDGQEWGEWVCGECQYKNYYEHFPEFDWSDD